MNDQLERDVEAALARLATDAVPDTRRAPAPPWREQHERRFRTADVRRFGRATPWLVAAVMLVIAGLGIGAAVTFDASASDRGPAVTDPPSPTATLPDSTAPTSGATASSHPTFSRDSNSTGPDDGVSAYVIGFGGYGPIVTGMTQSAVLAALGLTDADVSPGPNTCYRMITIPGQAAHGPATVYIDTKTSEVALVNPPVDAVDQDGDGIGTTLAELRADHPDGQLSLSVSGWVFHRDSVSDVAGTGYVLSTDMSAQPKDTDTVTEVLVGTADFARGYEMFCKTG